MDNEVFKYSPNFQKLLSETESDFKQFNKGRQTELFELHAYQIGAISVSYQLLQEDNERLHKALAEIMRFKSLLDYAADKLQYSDNFLKAIREGEKAINQSLIELKKSCAK